MSLRECAAAFLKGRKDKTALKDFMNSFKGEPWRNITVERKEDRILALRDDRPRGRVPGRGVAAALFAGVDTQDNGFFYRVRAFGWGMEQESWGVREGELDSFEALAQVLWNEQYLDADGNEYHVRLAIMDAMGHRTSQVYDFVRMHPGKIIAAQGVDNRRMIKPLSWTNIDYYPGTSKVIPGGIRLLRIDVNHYKNDLAAKLEINPEDPGAFHLHSEATEEYARHMCAEYLDDEKQIWVCPSGKANHYWDCEVYAMVAADLLRVRYWPKPGEREQDAPAHGVAENRVLKSNFMSRAR